MPRSDDGGSAFLRTMDMTTSATFFFQPNSKTYDAGMRTERNTRTPTAMLAARLAFGCCGIRKAPEPASLVTDDIVLTDDTAATTGATGMSGTDTTAGGAEAGVIGE